MDNSNGTKNGYLSFIVVVECENILYSMGVKDNCKNVFNSVMVRDHNENVYMSCGIFKSFNIFYSRYVTDSSNLRACYNMVGCHDCILCHELENKSFCIQNTEYSKEEYLKKKEQILKEKDILRKTYAYKFPQAMNFASTNIHNCTSVIKSEDIEN